MKNITTLPILLTIILYSLSACTQSHLNTNLNRPSAKQESGKASYYADKYQGRQTASGESFNQNARTAAHKTLGFGTWVKVTNVSNGKSVVVRINDRGPFIKGRVIDLSKSSFSAIANPSVGIVDVVVEIISK